jgi:hypothetical protein
MFVMPASHSSSSTWQASHISKKKFHSGGMALLERMQHVRGVRDTLGADYSVGSVTATRCVAHRLPYTVSLFLLVLSVFHFK